MSLRIKSIKFNGAKTEIKFHSADKPRDYNEIVEETNTKKSDQIRHKKFNEALSAMTPHLAIGYGFETAFDTTGVLFEHTFFTSGDWEDNPRFDKLTLTGIIVTGKDAADGIQLVGTILTPQGEEAALKTPPIGLLKLTEGWNYPLQDILRVQWQMLEERCQDFLNGVTGATGIQASMKLDTPKAQPKEVKPVANTVAKKVIAAAGVPMTN